MSPPTIIDATSTPRNTIVMYLSCSDRLTRTVLRWNFWVGGLVMGLIEQVVRELEPVLRHDLELRGRGLEADGHDLLAALGDHVAELALVHEVGGLDAHARAEDAVEHRRRAAALHMADHGRARLDLGLGLDDLGQALGDAAVLEDHVAELVELLLLLLAGDVHGLGGDDEGDLLLGVRG